jgi:hypothetical protein
MRGEGRYSVWTAGEELYVLEEELFKKAAQLVEKKDCYELARMLVVIDKEVYKYEEEARRLRLTGELDLDVYRELISSYNGIRQKIFKLINENKLSNDVSRLFKLMRFSNEVAGLYLTGYLQELDSQGATI